MAQEDYSSHDWRKHTHDAVVVSSDSSMQTSMEVNKSKVIFTNPNTLKKQEVDLSRLIRVFCNNAVGHKKSIK